MTKIRAIKTFRNKHAKGDIIQRGSSVELDDDYAAELVRTGLAVDSVKALKEHENKMLADYEDKNLPVHTETEDQRAQGMIGPTKDSETPEERTQGKNGVKKSAIAAADTASKQKETPNKGPAPAKTKTRGDKANPSGPRRKNQ
jgi:hypothetical protein